MTTRYSQVRDRILRLYGRKCNFCGYRKDERALQVDHIEGNPDKRYRSGSSLYDAILNGTLSMHLFQLLCANCNAIKKYVAPRERPYYRRKESGN